MEKNKIIIIGRGSSCLKCTADFVNEHDLVVVTNKFIFRGYENYVGDKIDIQFRNGTCALFTENELKVLGLKKIIYSHGNNKFPIYPNYYKDIEIINPKPSICTTFPFGFNPITGIAASYGFNPSTGIVALYYMLKYYDVDELSLVGFDFYEVGQKPYYFSLDDTDRELKYLWLDGYYEEDRIIVESGHNTEKTIEFVKKMILEHEHIKFNVITNSKQLSEFTSINLNLIKNL